MSANPNQKPNQNDPAVEAIRNPITPIREPLDSASESLITHSDLGAIQDLRVSRETRRPEARPIFECSWVDYDLPIVHRNDPETHGNDAPCLGTCPVCRHAVYAVAVHQRCRARWTT